MPTLATCGLQIRQNKRRHTAPNDVPPLLLSVCYLARRSGFACFHGLVNLGRHLFLEFRVVAQYCLRGLLALAELRASIAVPRTALLEDAEVDAKVNDLAHTADAFAIHDFELGTAEGRRHFVLHYLDFHLVAHHFVAVLNGRRLADVEAHRRVELQGVAARGGLRIAEHDANLLAQLVDER